MMPRQAWMPVLSFCEHSYTLVLASSSTVYIRSWNYTRPESEQSVRIPDVPLLTRMLSDDSVFLWELSKSKGVSNHWAAKRDRKGRNEGDGISQHVTEVITGSTASALPVRLVKLKDNRKCWHRAGRNPVEFPPSLFVVDFNHDCRHCCSQAIFACNIYDFVIC